MPVPLLDHAEEVNRKPSILRQLKYEPAKKFKIHTSSKLHPAFSVPSPVIEMRKVPSQQKVEMQIWLPEALSGDWEAGWSHVMTFSCKSYVEAISPNDAS